MWNDLTTPKSPLEWKWTTIKEIGEVVTGTTPSKSQPKYYGKDYPLFKPTDLNKGFYVRNAEDGLSHEGIRRSRLLPANSILVTCIGATIGKTGFSRVEGASNQQINAVIPASNILPEYLYFWCISPQFQAEIKGNASSTTLPILNKSKFESLPFPLAPHSEQRRIVAKIEELFTKLDAGVTSLKAAKKQLKRYRQSVLKTAVEGELTRIWREQHKDELEPASILLERILRERREKWETNQLAKMQAQGKTPKDDQWKAKYQEPAAPDISNLSVLPKEWKWTFTQQLGEVQLGRQRSPKNRSKDYPTKYIRAANITEQGLDLSDVLDMEFEPHEIERYLLNNGDIVLSEASGSPRQVGKPAIWRNQLPICCFQNTVIRLSPHGILSEFLLTVFKGYYVNGLFSKIAAGVGINHLSADKFSTVVVPLPPLLEQLQIVAEVERRLSIADEIESTLDAELKRAERLRQSILKRAFEGKLVPQDPNDEPASVLLERIKAEKAQRETEAARKKSRRARESENGSLLS
jgi:type I restriction enzyme S subunit